MYQIKGYTAALLVVFLFCSMVIPLAASTPAVLRPGILGAEVKSLQSALQEVGFPLKVDGIYGPETTKAVQELQRRQGLQVDGLAGPATRKALDGLLNTENLTHVVARGECLSVIAQRYSVPLKTLMEANGLVSSKIIVGQKLTIPRAVPVNPSQAKLTTRCRGKTPCMPLRAASTPRCPSFCVTTICLIQIACRSVKRSPVPLRTARLPLIWPVRGPDKLGLRLADPSRLWPEALPRQHRHRGAFRNAGPRRGLRDRQPHWVDGGRRARGGDRSRRRHHHLSICTTPASSSAKASGCGLAM